MVLLQAFIVTDISGLVVDRNTLKELTLETAKKYFFSGTSRILVSPVKLCI
jgi:hypothetical protein